MAGMAAEGREIPIADRELTRGRRGTHSDRAQHHRRWFRAPARCRSETGAPPSARFCSVGGTRFRPPLGGRCRSETGAPPSPRFAQLGVRGFDRLSGVDAGRRPALRRPRAFAQLGVRGFDRLPAVDAGRRPALQAVPALLLSWGYAVSTASRGSMPVGDRRSAVPALLLSWGTRFRPPLGGRCRSETGAPPSPRFCSVGGTRFRPPLGGRCRSETGAPPSPRFAQSGVRGFDRLSVVDAGRRPALRRPRVLLSWGYAVSTASRRSMPVGDRRSAVPAFCSVGVRGFDRLPAVDAGRRPALRRPRAFAQLGVRGFDRLPAVDAGRRPALRRPRAFAQLGYAVSTASRRVDAGRRPALRRPRAFAQLGVRGFYRLPAVDAGRRPALRRPRACSRSTMRDLDARRAVRNPGLGVSLLRLRLCVTPRQGSAQRSCPGFPSHCRFQRAAVLQGSAVAGESQQSRRFSGTARHVLRARPRQRSGKDASGLPQGSLGSPSYPLSEAAPEGRRPGPPRPR